MKFHTVLLACALSAGSLLGAMAPASAAHVSVRTARLGATGRVLPGNRYYRTAYRGSPYRYGYGYPYGYAPYPAVYKHRAYWAPRRYWRHYRRAYWGQRFVR